jgi:putative DNA primase/helicase
MPDERRDLLSLARSFDQMPDTAFRESEATKREREAAGRPGDAFIAQASWEDILVPHGWRPLRRIGDETYWRRPGKDRGQSATTNYRNSDLLYVFSSSTEFEIERGYNKFSAYAILEHGGDWRAAATELRRRGYGADEVSAASLGRIHLNGAAHTEDETEEALPEIYADEQDLRIITGQAWDALAAVNEAEPFMFRHGGALVRIEQDDQKRPIFRELTLSVIRHEMARSAVWWGMRGSKAEKARKVVVPPDVICQDVLATPAPPLPTVTRVTECPTFGPDWSVRTTAGYHASGRTYCAIPPEITMRPVSDRPTATEVRQAKAFILEDVLGDFPFVGPADLANAIGLFLLPFVRDAITGPTPLHMVESPTVGTGKGLIVDALLRASCGRSVAAIAQCREGDEWRKRITSMLRGGFPAIQIDNVTRALDSGELAMALTVPYWTDRLLGSSQTVSYPVRCVWVATANNPVLSTEMARRSIRIRMDPKVDKPWEREGFRHAELLGWIDDHRGALIWGALTLVQAWIANGKEKFSGRALGSFEQWTRIIGGILEQNDIKGFLGNLAEFYEQADTEGSTWRSFTEAWWEKFEGREVGASELFPLALEVDGFEVNGNNERAQKTSFGKALGKQRDRVIGRFRVCVSGGRRRNVLWRLQLVEAS